MSRKNKYIMSWRGQGVAVRDARADRPIEEEPKHRNRGKDTKRWCKGVEGREHVTKVVPLSEIAHHPFGPPLHKESQVRICEVCRKQLEIIWA